MVSVVIIEDEQRIRQLVAGVLAERGYDVTSSGSALEGLQAVVSDTPDLIILDMGLPDLDGAELLTMIRAVTKAPVIVATARGADSDVVRTLDAGADDYLVEAVLRRAARGPGAGGDAALDRRPAPWASGGGGRARDRRPNPRWPASTATSST